jgi:hypothetical protein
MGKTKSSDEQEITIVYLTFREGSKDIEYIIQKLQKLLSVSVVVYGLCIDDTFKLIADTLNVQLTKWLRIPWKNEQR